ncbi:hypothetical protein QV65_03665 [Rhodococcus erythropolis]|nr:hypothetical protein QV65_03665 [Rhodococcus erythropolis]
MIEHSVTFGEDLSSKIGDRDDLSSSVLRITFADDMSVVLQSVEVGDDVSLVEDDSLCEFFLVTRSKFLECAQDCVLVRQETYSRECFGIDLPNPESSANEHESWSA